MQVVVLLLLVAGLALLVLGLITGSTPLVVGSIAASLLAAMAIVRYRRGREAGLGASSEPAMAPSAVAPSAVAPSDGRAEQSRDGTATPVRAPARVPASAEPLPATVPPAHAAESSGGEPAPAAEQTALLASGTAPAASETALIPTGTAPAASETTSAEADADPAEADADPAEAHTDPPLRSRGDESVWVIDGRPRYHLPGCAFLLGRETVPVPLRQAVEDGFTPCGLCDPDSGLAAR